ncbi:MAG: hypothetical protein V1644_02390 [Candidatus Micrarchaeota archaeon]
MRFLLKEFFAGRNYGSARDALEHLQTVSDRIKIKPKPVREFPMSPFTKIVLELAPLHLRGQYKLCEIARCILEKDKKPITPQTLRSMHHKVRRALLSLKRKELIPQTTVHDKPLGSRKIRDVPLSEVNQHIGIIHAVLNRGHRFLPFYWRKVMSYHTAVELGRDAVHWALETHDPKAGACFFTHASNAVARELSREARARRKTVSLDARSQGDKRTLHEKIGFRNAEFDESDLELLIRSRLVEPHQIGVFGLVAIFGHSKADLARHFKVSREAIRRIYNKAAQLIQNRRKQ